LLQRSGVPFIEEDLSNDPEKLMALKERTGHSTVPMILLDDALIGGYMELQSRISSDGAESLMPTE
jgi:glutaredoxin